jgi:hypothetical protein
MAAARRRGGTISEPVAHFGGCVISTAGPASTAASTAAATGPSDTGQAGSATGGDAPAEPVRGQRKQRLIPPDFTYEDLQALCASADRFKSTFAPQPDVKYDWVVGYAKDEYARAVEVFKRLDDKAAVVANYLGAGTGLLTLGSVAGVASATASPWIVLAALPAVALAMLALVCASAARRTAFRPAPPTIKDAIDYAEYFGDRAEIHFLGLWHLTVEMMYPVLNRKAHLVNRSVSFFVWAVLALSLPLAVGLGVRFAA